MAQFSDALSDEQQAFIAAQHLFFVATAAADGRINLSPKGRDSMRVLGPNDLVWLNLTGSGNETAAHINAVNRMTLMWCAFAGTPEILRVYGSARAVHPFDEADWAECESLLPAALGARQYFRVKIDQVQSSCGYAVPFMDYVEDRTVLEKWSHKRGEEGLQRYQQEKNRVSIDGLPTGIEGNRNLF